MDNPFKQFLDFKKLGLLKKDASVLGIDIGSSSVKVVQLRKNKGRVILETYGELATGPYANLAVGQVANLPVDRVAELLRDLFKEANITATKAAIAIPLKSSLLVTLQIPNTGREEIGKIVPIEARKYIPVPISEVEMDWWIMPQKMEDDGEEKKTQGVEQVEALVVAIHKDTIGQYREIAKQAGLEPVVFEIETFGAIRSAVAVDLSAKAVLDLGAGSAKLSIVDYGITRTSHVINRGAQDITMAVSRSLGVPMAKAEEIKRKVGLVERLEGETLTGVINPVVDFIFTDMNRAMLDYQKKYRRTFDKVVLVGGGAMLKGLLESARTSTDLPVILGTPFDRVETPAFLEEVLKEAGPGFAVAIGLALRGLQEI